MEPLHHKHSLNCPVANVVAVALCYLIGCYGLNVVFVIPIFTVLFTYWNQCYEVFAKCVLLQAEYMETKKRVLKSGESLEWVNHAIDRWWTCCNVSIGRFVKDWIEPIVEQFKFPIVVESMKILAFDTGLYRPRFSNLRLLQPVKQPSGYSKNGPPLQTYTHVTLDTLTTPHYVMATENWSKLEFEMDADFNVPFADFKIRAKIGRGNISQNLLLNVESFHVGGTLRCVINSDKKAPFPHITTADVCFVPKPVVECTCRALKDILEVTDVPGMKQIIQKYIIMGFKRLLVDPGKQHVDFTPAPLPGPEWSTLADGDLSRGVLTVTIESSAKDDSLSLKGRGFEPNQYCKLRVGNQRCIRHFNSLADQWSSTFSFLVRDPEKEKLVVKLKAKRRFVRDFMTAHFSIPLLDVCEGDSATRSIKRFPVLAEDDVEKLHLSLLYTPLPTISLLDPAPAVNHHIPEAGVLYVHVHATKNVRIPTPSSNNVFCCVTWGEKTILQTHALPASCDPVWEKGIELIVPSCNGIRLEFNVLSQSQGMATNSLVGSTFLSLNENETHLVQHRLLFTSYSKGRTPMSLNSPSLYVSVIFRHVESVNWTRESLKETFISRTRRRNAASCLDLTTNFMNPVGRGFGFSPHIEEDSEVQQPYSAYGRGMSLEEFSSSGESSGTKDSVSVSSY